MKFKKGDILEFIGAETYSAQKGAIAICTGDNGYLQVEWIRNGFDGGQMDGEYHSNWFKKIGELSSQKEDRILEENKEKVMKFNFEEGKQRVITMLEEHIYDFSSDMFIDIKGLARDEDEDAIDKIEDIIDIIRSNTKHCEKAIDKVKQAKSVAEVLDAVSMTCYEEMEEVVLATLMGLDELTIK